MPELQGTAREALGEVLDVANRIATWVIGGERVGEEVSARLVELVRIGLGDLEARPQSEEEIQPTASDRADRVLALIDRALTLAETVAERPRPRGELGIGHVLTRPKPLTVATVGRLDELGRSWDEVAAEREKTLDYAAEGPVWRTCARQLRRVLDGRDGE